MGLANIALNGLELEVLNRVGQRKVKVIRYADDFLIIGREKADVEKAKCVSEDFLRTVGLNLNLDKTKIRHSVMNLHGDYKGVNYLGYHFYQKVVSKHHAIRKPSGGLASVKVVTRPSWKSVKDHLRAIKEVISELKMVPQEALIQRLLPLIRG